MIELELLKTTRINDNNQEEMIEVLVAFTVYKTNEYINISRMEVQVFPLYSTNKIGDNMFVNNINNWNPSKYETFDLEINHEYKRAKFFNEDIILPKEIQNTGIGCYIISKLITWGKDNALNYNIKNIKLSFVDAKTNKERDLRNTFYGRQGFELVFYDDDQRCYGAAKANNFDQLTPYYNKDKITITKPWASLYSDKLAYRNLMVDLHYTETDKQSYINELVKTEQEYKKFKFFTLIFVMLLLLIITALMN